MATLNNEPVLVGDRVYDVTQGMGTVIDTTFNEIAVRFDSGVRIGFDSTGHYAGVRRLYWHNPVVVEPSKDNSLWATLVSCIEAVYAHLR